MFVTAIVFVTSVVGAEPPLGDELIEAAGRGDLEVVRALLAQGVDPDHQKDCCVALSKAAAAGHGLVIDVLLSAGANPNVPHGVCSALTEAACQGDTSIVRLLLNGGADVDSRSSKRHDTALIEAAKHGYEDIVELVLERGADLNLRDNVNWTALHYAAQNGTTQIVQSLLEQGAQVDPVDDLGGTPLTEAVVKGHELVVNLLLHYGADVRHRDRKGRTVVLRAATWGRERILESLVTAGADLDGVDHQGRTALICAAQYGHEAMVQRLIGLDVDLDHENHGGETALVVAGQAGYRQIVEQLRQAGAIQIDVFLHHFPDVEPALTAAEGFALAIPSIVVTYNRENPNLLGHDVKEHQEEIRRGLEKWWGITDRDQAMGRLRRLRLDGQRKEFKEFGKWAVSVSQEKFEAFIRNHHDNANYVAKLRLAREHYVPLGRRGIMGWDLCRHVYLAGQSYLAGYITKAEAWNEIMLVARMAQANFDSWEDLGRNYLLGRQFWAGVRNERMDFIIELLLDPSQENSPWNRYPWDTHLHGNRPRP